MAENLVKAYPKTYFKFSACATCFQTPCERLRYGGVYPGKFIILHSHEYSFTNCQFAADSIDEVDQLLSNLQLHDIIYEIDKVISLMSPAEQIHWDMSHFVTEYSDRAGRMKFIRRLWEERIIIILRIPNFYQQDLKVRSWLHALEGGFELSHKITQKGDLSSKAATDTLIKADEKTGSDDTINPKTPEDVALSTVVINLAIDLEDTENHNDLFVLESIDKSYRQSKTVKDDTVEGNDTLDLEYTGINSALTYNLFVDHGDHGGKQSYFENIQGKDLLKNVP
jgi:hypothetical protein